MINTLLATKIKMGQTFVGNVRTPVTIVKAGPCVVTQIKTQDKHGYNALQIGFGNKRIKNTTKPLQGHTKGAYQEKAPRFLKEVRVSELPEMKVGDTVTVAEVFAEGDLVTVTGTSKGKGFAGGVKRWGFRGGPKTHGQSDRMRAPGSIGQGTTPGRVHKGKKMAGRMGSEQKTLKKIKIIEINAEKGEIKLSGPLPGTKGSLLIISK